MKAILKRIVDFGLLIIGVVKLINFFLSLQSIKLNSKITLLKTIETLKNCKKTKLDYFKRISGVASPV